MSQTQNVAPANGTGGEQIAPPNRQNVPGPNEGIRPSQPYLLATVRGQNNSPNPGK